MYTQRASSGKFEVEVNRCMFERESANLMRDLEYIFEATDQEIANNFIMEVYLSARMQRSCASQTLIKLGSRIFPRLGKYLKTRRMYYPQRDFFWAMLINVICMKENICDKPLALSQFNEWVIWIRMKYPH